VGFKKRNNNQICLSVKQRDEIQKLAAFGSLDFTELHKGSLRALERHGLINRQGRMVRLSAAGRKVLDA
jgi:ribosomal protein S19E (S16A)